MTGRAFLARTIHGRADVLDALGRLVDTPGGAAALVGEAGIGKTRLALWVAERAREARRTVVVGQSVLGLAEPLGPVCDLVRSARRDGLEPPSRDPLVTGFPARVLPELGGGATDSGNLGAIFEGAARYVEALAGRRGGVVILEDLHWADGTTLSLVPFLARALRAAPISLLLTYRPDEESAIPAVEAMRAELRRTRLADEIALGPLSEQDAAAMLAELLGHAPAPEVRDELLRLSGGNPFALEELTRAAAESGWLDPASGRRRGTSAVDVPWTLAESIRARAGRLDPPEREIIEWAAAVGDRFDVRLVAAASGQSAVTVLELLEAPAAAGLVIEAPGDSTGNAFAFRHALVHEALSQEGLRGRRRARHAAVLAAAEALADDGTLEISAAELARHAMAAGDRERTLAHSRAAVARAQELGAVEEAVAHLERALALWEEADGRPLRAELLFACGRLRARLARGDERAVELLLQARDELRALGDDETALWCLAVLADARYEIGDRSQALADWEVAVPELRGRADLAPLQSALVGYSRGLALNGRVPEAIRAAEEGLALVPVARSTQDAFERVNLLITRGMLHMFRFEVDAGKLAIHEAIRLAMEHQDDVGAARGHHILGVGVIYACPVPEGIAHLSAAAELVERHGLRSLQAFYLTLRAAMCTEAGDGSSAERLFDEAQELVDDDERATWTRFQIAFYRAMQMTMVGDLDGAARMAVALIDDRFSSESVVHAHGVQRVLATARLLAGDTSGALEALHPAIDAARADLADGEPLDPEEAPTHIEVLVAAGRVAEAVELADAVHRSYPSPWSDYCRSLVSAGEPMSVAAAVAAAAAGVETDGWRWAGARMHIAGAIILADRPGGRAAAVTLAREALERFRAMGSDAWCRRLEGMLRSWGERAPTRAGPGEGGLSRRELEVLALVAEGLTNRQIAERLVISEHTAIRHVSNLMGKLGAPSRAAAVRMAAERGLLAADAGGEMARPAGVE